MKGYQAHSSSPMKKNGLWGKFKEKAKKVKQYVKDKTVNMSNLVGNDPETQAMRKAEFARQDKMLKDQKKRIENSNKDDDARDKAYRDYKDKHGWGADQHDAATEAGNQAVKDRYAKVESDLASKSPKTEKESKSQPKNEGLLAKNIKSSSDKKSKNTASVDKPSKDNKKDKKV